MKAQFFGASGHFIFSEQYIADWTANSDATTWCIQCMKMLRERWTTQTAWYNSILLIMKYFAYRYICTVMCQMYGICNISNTCMFSCHHVTITYTLVGKFLILVKIVLTLHPVGQKCYTKCSCVRTKTEKPNISLLS